MRVMDMDIKKKCEVIATNAHAGDTIYTKCWSKARRNKGFLPGRCLLDGNKTRQHCGKVSSYVFIAIKTVTPVWAFTNILDATLTSVAEA